MYIKVNILIFLYACFSLASIAQEKIFPGADEKTPSRSEYFSWINNTNEGTTEKQTLISLEFFKWLKDQYGMQLDIYAFDAGAIDGKRFYGNMQSDRFRNQFPNGFTPIIKKAGAMGTRLGLWGGPDGFGNTPEEANQRIDMMVSLCRDYHFELFKMDAVCGQLRPEKYDAFNRMMTECRKYSPDLVLLNHRLNLGRGMAHSTTFLLGGAETYIDIFTSNSTTASHHRAGALARELPPRLTRLTEDHGVCLSSYLDYWEDDLILQAFNRNLVLAPEIYGNPWLLRDDEYPLLARIFNLHRKYRDILVDGMVLPEDQYGLNAVSRGDDQTRLVTLRNLTWEPVTYSIKLDSSIGLKGMKNVQVRTYHPTEKIMGSFPYESKVTVEVLPFRSCFVKLSDASVDNEFSIGGIDYQIIPNAKDDSKLVQLMAMPGSKKKVKLTGDYSVYKSATIDGKDVSSLLKGKSVTVQFDGESLKHSYHRKLTTLEECPIPDDAESVYESTCFAGSNNALEAQELARSGATRIPQVQAARDAFFNQQIFKDREIWDRYLFDGDLSSAYSVSMRHNMIDPLGITFRLDLGKVTALDSLVIKTFDGYSLQPLKSEEGNNAKVSSDLVNWEDAFFLAGKSMKMDLTSFRPIRYVKLHPAPLRIAEIIGYKNGVMVDHSGWKASNLFSPYFPNHWRKNLVNFAQKAWSSEIRLDEIPQGSYLCIAVNGEHGVEGAYAGLKIDGEYAGCPDRAPSFKSNVWEADVKEVDKNYTYYFPLKKEMIGKKIEVFVVGFDKDHLYLKPEIYITAYPIPFKKKLLVLK
ncbi:MAG: hypothetical protein AB2L24_30520 [Mangrovibacterium sp.]